MRVRSPSTTLTLTSTVSPGANAGISLPLESLAISSRSIVSRIFMAHLGPPLRGRSERTEDRGRPRLYDIARTLSFLFRPLATLPQIGPPLAGRPLRLAAAPRRHLAVITGNEHLGDRAALELLRPGVLRVFQEARLETLVGARRLLAHHPRQKPYAGIEQRVGGDLASRQHEVAHGTLFEAARGDDPFVDALIAAADEHDTRPAGELTHAALRERPAARRQQDARARIARRRRRVERAREHVGAHHHAGTAARRRVVNRAMLVERVRPDVDGVARPQASQRAAGEACTKRPGKKLRKQGDYARPPGHRPSSACSPAKIPAGGSTTMTPA